MNDPNELSPEARAFLDQVRGADDPRPEDRARVRRALMTAIAGGAGVAASTAASTAAAAATTTAGATATGVGASLTLKIAAAVLVVGAVTGTTVAVVAPWEAPEPRPAVEPPRSTAEEAPAPREIAPPVPARAEPIEAPVAEPPPAAAPPEPAPAVPAEPAPAAPRVRAEPARRAPSVAAVPSEPAPAPASEPAPPPTPDSIAEETRILRSAQLALHAGDAASALARLAEHERRFPRGLLAQEREAIRILATCRADRAGAREAAAEFLRRHPSSPHAARIRASCE